MYGHAIVVYPGLSIRRMETHITLTMNSPTIFDTITNKYKVIITMSNQSKYVVLKIKYFGKS